MAYSRFPITPSNLPPESVKWGKEVEAVFNDLLARLVAAETQLTALRSRR